MNDLAFSASTNNPLVDAFLAARGIAAGGLVLDIHRDDEMLAFTRDAAGGDFDAAAEYFTAGWSVLDSIRQLVGWRFRGFEQLGAMLDFASGYGRVTRHLVRELPPERLWISDIYPGAVEFQRRRFGVHGFLSSSRPADLAPPRRFDLVFVASLFTHLPRSAFEAWLARLLGLLEPGGLLAFSVHDASLRDPSLAMPPEGFLFQARSESRSLDPEQYGSSWVSEEYVRGAVEHLAPGSTCARLPLGLCHYQDLYVVVPDGADLRTLAYDPGPEGFLEGAEAGHGRLVLRGWAAELDPAHRVAEVRAWLDGAMAARVTEFGPHVGVGASFPHLGAEPAAAWRLTLALREDLRFSAAALFVEATSDAGVSSVVFLGSVEAALRRSALWDAHLAARVTQAAEAARQAAELRVRALEARIAAMEASRFWKLRNRWFALKRALRLSTER